MEGFEQSDHFDGKKYFNPYYRESRGVFHFLRWQLNRQSTPWAEQNPILPQKVKKQRVPKGELWVTYIGHDTTLIQLEGYNILTDPIWSDRASPLSWLGPKRFVDPGVNFEDLPPIDFVVVSHNHYDHMDLPTLKRIANEYHPKFFVPMGNKSFFEENGIGPVTEMDWWDQIKLAPDLTLTFVPAQHFSSRTLWDRNETLWGGYVLESPSQRVYFAGDTGYSPYFKEIRQRLGAPTLSLLPIGAFKPEWFMRPMHLSPKSAVQAHLDLGSSQSLAIHFGVFRLSDEGIDEPVLELQKAIKNQNVDPNQFWVLKPGESRQVKGKKESP